MTLLYNPAQDVLLSRTDLHAMETPAAMGRFHQPYAFGDYVDEVYDALNREGVKISNEEYAVTKDGQRMFGMVELAPMEGELITAKDWKLTLGIRGSHDQSIARGLALGTQVMVCSNLCFHGDLGTLRTKQTTNIGQRIPTMIRDAIAHIPEQAQRQEQVFDAYRNTSLRPRHGDAALVELHRRGALTAAQLGTAIREWDEPTHAEHAEQGHSVWRAFNAATEALKPTGQNINMELIRSRSEAVSGFLNEVVGI